jgi:hypothetical protein
MKYERRNCLARTAYPVVVSGRKQGGAGRGIISRFCSCWVRRYEPEEGDIGGEGGIWFCTRICVCLCSCGRERREMMDGVSFPIMPRRKEKRRGGEG